MLSSIYSPEITALEDQVSQLEAQINAAKQRITILNDADGDANVGISAIAAALEKGKTLAPSANARLKAALLALFKSNGDGNDGGGNQPLAPTPSPNDDPTLELALSEQTLEDDPELAEHQSLEDSEFVPDEDYLGENEKLEGQASEFACLLEDAPESALKNQSVEIACVISDRQKGRDFVELLPFSHSVACQMKTVTGEVVCAYLGGNNKAKLKAWGEYLSVRHSIAAGFEIRESKRLTEFKHELKLWGMSLSQVEKLANTDTSKQPPSPGNGVNLQRNQEPVAPPVHPTFHVGDIVASKLVPSWEYKVTEVIDSYSLKGQRINGSNSLIFSLNHNQLDLVSKAAEVEGEAIATSEDDLTAAPDIVAETSQEGQLSDSSAGETPIQTASPGDFKIGDRVTEFGKPEIGVVTGVSAAFLEVDFSGREEYLSFDQVELAASVTRSPTSTPAYNFYARGRKAAQANWDIYREYRSAERDRVLAQATVGAPADDIVDQGEHEFRQQVDERELAIASASDTDDSWPPF